MKKFLVALVMCLGLVALNANAVSAANITCPSGTMHAGKSKPTYAECNVPTAEDSDATQDLKDTIKNILNAVLGVLGVVAVVVVILGGFTFLTSQGDAAKVMKGRNTIIWGIIGLVVALMAFAIVNFVLGNAFGSSGGEPDDPDGGDGYVQTTYIA